MVINITIINNSCNNITRREQFKKMNSREEKPEERVENRNASLKSSFALEGLKT